MINFNINKYNTADLKSRVDMAYSGSQCHICSLIYEIPCRNVIDYCLFIFDEPFMRCE